MGSIDRKDSTPQLLNRLRMRQIALMLAVREQRTLRGAAAQLGMSQPAATKMLHELENALGIRLFERVGRGLRLSGAGERVMEYCQSLRGSMEALNRELVELREGSAGRLAVGSIMAASPGRLTKALLSIKQQRWWPCCRPPSPATTPSTACCASCLIRYSGAWRPMAASCTATGR